MKTTHDWVPQNHEALYDQANQTRNYLLVPVNRERMGFEPTTPQGQWVDTSFEPDFQAFSTAFGNWRDPSQRTPVMTTLLEEAEKPFRVTYRQLYTGFLKSSPLVTDDDLQRMGLPKRHAGGNTPSPVAGKAPDFDVDTSVIGHVGIDFYEKEAGHRKAKPAGQHCVEIAWIVSDTPPTRWDELIHSAVDTRSPYTFQFENDQRGKTLYFALRWENTRGEKGPWSEIQSAIIP